MREQSMFYKMKNIIGVSAIAMIMAATYTDAFAQGVVTLSEEAMFNDDMDMPDLEKGADALGNIKEDVLDTPAKKETVAVVQQIKNDVAKIDKIGESDEDIEAEIDEALRKATTEDLTNLENVSAPDEDVFARMSDLEKQTALLNLELRREKVKNEILAIKNQRRQAEIQEVEKAAEAKRKQQEQEKEQERKVLEEQQRLRELDIEFEKLRQEKLLNAYKNEMLAAHQEWIAHEGDLYKQIDTLKKEKQALLTEMTGKVNEVKAAVSNADAQATAMADAYQQEFGNMKTKMSILLARIDAQEQELEKRNPFAEGASPEAGVAGGSAMSTPIETVIVPELKLPNLYAVMEIRGQNGELVAKLINKDGLPFYVKKGTTLQSGHIIDEITSTYVRAEKGGVRDYLYFAAGGILPIEQAQSGILPAIDTLPEPVVEEVQPSFASSRGVPGLGKSMLAR